MPEYRIGNEIPEKLRFAFCVIHRIFENPKHEASDSLNNPLPQQKLLLELLDMSGDIAVPSADNGSMLFRTLQECREARWIELSPFGAGFDKAHITVSGRRIVNNP